MEEEGKEENLLPHTEPKDRSIVRIIQGAVDGGTQPIDIS